MPSSSTVAACRASALESFDKPRRRGRDHRHRPAPMPMAAAYFDPDNDPKAKLWYWWDIPAMLAPADLPADCQARALRGAAAARRRGGRVPEAAGTQGQSRATIIWAMPSPGSAWPCAARGVGVYIRTLMNRGELAMPPAGEKIHRLKLAASAALNWLPRHSEEDHRRCAMFQPGARPRNSASRMCC